MDKPKPYDTGKVLIGCYYQRPIRADFTEEEYQIQRALLKPSRTDWNLVLDEVLAFSGFIFAITLLILAYAIY